MRKYLHVAFITAAHGVHGEVKVRVLSEDADRLKELDELNLLSPDESFLRRVRFCVRGARDNVIIKLDDVNSRDRAESLRGHYLSVTRDEALPLPEGRYFVCDLIGLKVIDHERGAIGHVRDVLDYQPFDLLVVRRPGRKDILIPMREGVFLDADPAGGTLRVSLPDGLWEIYED